MNTHADKTPERTGRTGNESRKPESAATYIADNRPGTLARNDLQQAADRHASTTPAAQLQAAADASKESQPVKTNNTGLPDKLKSGIESLSGYSMDAVNVHYNSAKPAQLQAHAYAQGTDIHLASGQEQHLPHEAWHVVQQMQGRVQPTTQLKAVNINDDTALEKEADVMGQRALTHEGTGTVQAKSIQTGTAAPIQLVRAGDIPVTKNGAPEIPGQQFLIPQGDVMSGITYIKATFVGSQGGPSWGLRFFKVEGDPQLRIIIAGSEVREVQEIQEVQEKMEVEDHQQNALGDDVPVDDVQIDVQDDEEDVVKKDESGNIQPHTQAPNAEDESYFKDTKIGTMRAEKVYKALLKAYTKTDIVPKQQLIDLLKKECSDLTDGQIQDAILFLRKAGALYPAYPGPKLNAVASFSMDETYTEDKKDGKQKDKSLTEFIERIIRDKKITGHNKHDQVRNALIAAIKSNPLDKSWAPYRDELIRLFKVKTAAKYYTDAYVRAGDEHEQLITSLTADQVLYDLEHPVEVPGTTTGGQFTRLEFQKYTNVATQYIVLKTSTRQLAEGGKFSQNHHPTSDAMISFIDTKIPGKLHSSPGSGFGGSPNYHDQLGQFIEKNYGLEKLNEELAKVNDLNLAGRFDILNIPAAYRVNQTYKQTNGTILHFNDEQELHLIARNVEVRRRKVLGLFKVVHELLGSKKKFNYEFLDRGNDSDDEMDKLPKTPSQYDDDDRDVNN